MECDTVSVTVLPRRQGARLMGGERLRSVRERIESFRTTTEVAGESGGAVQGGSLPSADGVWWTLPPEHAADAFHKRRLRLAGVESHARASGAAQPVVEGRRVQFEQVDPSSARFGHDLRAEHGMFSSALDTGTQATSLAARVAALRSRRRLSGGGVPRIEGREEEHAFELPPSQEDLLVGWARVPRTSAVRVPVLPSGDGDGATSPAASSPLTKQPLHARPDVSPLSLRAFKRPSPLFPITREAAAVEREHDAGWHFGGPAAVDQLLHAAAAFNDALRADTQRAERVFSDLDTTGSGALRRAEVHALAATLVGRHSSTSEPLTFSTSAALWALLDVDARGQVTMPQLRAAAAATAEAAAEIQATGTTALPRLGRFMEGHMLTLAKEFENHGGPARRLPPLGAAQLVATTAAGSFPPSELRALILGLLAIGASADDGSVSLVDTLRCALSGRPEPWVTEARRRREAGAAITIQAGWRSLASRRWTRRYALHANDAAVALQAAARGFLVRQRSRKAVHVAQAALEASREAERVRAEAEEMNAAATRIQSIVRGRQARRLAHDMHVAQLRMRRSSLGQSLESERKDAGLAVQTAARAEASRLAEQQAERERQHAARLAAIEAAAAEAEAHKKLSEAKAEEARPSPMASWAGGASASDFPPLKASQAKEAGDAASTPVPMAPPPSAQRLDAETSRTIEAAAAAAAASAAAAEAAAAEAARHEVLAVSAIQQDVVAQLRLALDTGAPPADPRLAVLYAELRDANDTRIAAAEQAARQAAAAEGVHQHLAASAAAAPRACGVEDDISHAVAHVSHDLDVLIRRLSAMGMGMGALDSNADVNAAYLQPDDTPAPLVDADLTHQAAEVAGPARIASAHPADDAAEETPAPDDGFSAATAAPFVPPVVRPAPKVPDWAREDWASTLPPFMADLMRATVPELAVRAWHVAAQARPQVWQPSSRWRPAVSTFTPPPRPSSASTGRSDAQLSADVLSLCDTTWRQYDQVFGQTAGARVAQVA